MGIRERSIILDTKNTTLAIGRASKVESKGFVASEDNAWFDSPVMSRRHAEIVAHPDEKKVQVRDMGSLHGTYLNGTDNKLPAQEFRDLKDGDELLFGLPILRGSTEFMPTNVRVGIAFQTSRSCDGTSTFQVPDGSECSDSTSDEDAYSDDSSEDCDDSNASEDSVTHVVDSDPLLKPTCTSEVIDLTKGPEDADDASNNYHAREVIDLSSPPSSPSLSSPVGYPAAQEASLDIDGMEEEGEVFDVDELRIIFDSVPVTKFNEQTRRVLGAIQELAGPGAFDEHFSFLDPAHGNEGNYDGIDNSDASDNESYADYPDEVCSESDAISDEEVDYESDSDSDEDMNDNESSGEHEDEDDDQSIGSDLDSITGTVWDASNPDLAEARMVPAMPLFALADKATNSPFKVQELLNGPPTAVCKPSPSKTFNSTESGAANKAAAEELGAKTGKKHFFAAREDNKLIVNAHNSSQHGTTPSRRHTSSIYDLCDNQTSPTYRFNPTTSTKAPDNAQKLPSVYSMVDDVLDKNPLQLPPDSVGPYRRSPFFETYKVNYASKPAETLAPEPVKTVTPELAKVVAPESVMTVALKPVETASPEPIKAIASEPVNTIAPEPAEVNAPEPVKTTTPEPIETIAPEAAEARLPARTFFSRGPRRTGVAISDIVESHQNSTPKRKSNDISVTTAQEEEWAVTVATESQSASTVEPMREPSPTATVDSSSDVQVVAEAVAVQVPGDVAIEPQAFERPIKRMRLRRIVESMGMAALGGAMVMGTLIYTAPTFA